MNRLEPQSLSWSDDDVDALMTSFFERELPDALRESESPAPAAVQPGFARVSTAGAQQAGVNGRAAAPDSRHVRRLRSRAGLAAASLALVAVLVLIAGPPLSSRQAGHPATDTGDRSVDRVHDADAFASSGDADNERPASRGSAGSGADQGPVELRTIKGTTNVAVEEPQPDAKVEVKLDELNIEIIPIDE